MSLVSNRSDCDISIEISGFVHTIDHNKGVGGGQWNEYEFSDDVDPEKVKDAFEDRNLEWRNIDVRGIEE